MISYRVWSYDVWGNDEDGYSVNDRCEIDHGECSHYPSDDEITKIIGNNWDVKLVAIDWGSSDESNIEIVSAGDEYYPVGQIEIEVDSSC